MERPRQTGENTWIALLLCAVAGLLLHWPILSIVADRPGLFALAYLFSIWLGIIACLAWYCHGKSAAPSGEPGQEDGR